MHLRIQAGMTWVLSMENSFTMEFSFMKRFLPAVSVVLFGLSAHGQSADYYSHNDQYGYHERKGLYLSAGAGISSTTMEVEMDGMTADTQIDGNTGLQTAFKIGGSITPNVQLYYGRFASFGTFENAIDGSDEAYVTGLMGLGINLFAKDSNFFAEGLVGISDLTLLDESESLDPDVGFSIGLGYQVAKYVEISGRAMFYSVEDPDVDGLEYSLSQIGLTVSFCLY
ncbi:hypothetical Protein YC6258_04801 [Gynuella sunshinyii YC6258]|uniref:Outer membrane protein beta-barrel domain-containing protein n=2 Tax=Gynuella sunshinyii TaxID=1445505 RepID=A0A0C5VU54_9GAMM|nr:hypothetical Protein YC6258_04801 [Gynuella sunshinyii YC6258]